MLKTIANGFILIFLIAACVNGPDETAVKEIDSLGMFVNSVRDNIEVQNEAVWESYDKEFEERNRKIGQHELSEEQKKQLEKLMEEYDELKKLYKEKDTIYDLNENRYE